MQVVLCEDRCCKLFCVRASTYFRLTIAHTRLLCFFNAYLDKICVFYPMFWSLIYRMMLRRHTVYILFEQIYMFLKKNVLSTAGTKTCNAKRYLTHKWLIYFQPVMLSSFTLYFKFTHTSVINIKAGNWHLDSLCLYNRFLYYRSIFHLPLCALHGLLFIPLMYSVYITALIYICFTDELKLCLQIKSNSFYFYFSFTCSVIPGKCKNPFHIQI